MYIDVLIVRSMHGTVRSFGNFIYLEVFVSVAFHILTRLFV